MWSLKNTIDRWFKKNNEATTIVNTSKEDTLSEDIENYLLEVITMLGQMKHIEGKVECTKDHVKKEDKNNTNIQYNQHGVMSMPVKARMYLIDNGWNLLQKLKFKNI